MTLHLVSEAFSASGGVTARTLGRAVTSSPLEQAAIILRESLQNSLDARLSDSTPIGYKVAGWEATGSQRAALLNEVFAELPPSDLGIRQRLTSHEELPLLVVADCHTRGLGGPTRADRVTSEKADFRDFFLNVGREQKKGFGGGTYGLGRGVLFGVSEIGAVIAYTRTSSGGQGVRRLMAMAVGDDYEADGRKLTGRHWWGAASDDGAPLPAVDSVADALASELGILHYVPADTTGTVLLIVAPVMSSGLDLLGLVRSIQRAATLFAWPHMVESDACGCSVDFSFEFEGSPEELVDPSSPDSPVRRFVEAYSLACGDSARSGPTSWSVHEVMFKKGQAVPEPLGRLAFRHLPPERLDADLEADGETIPRSAVALMREPRLVVKYLAAPEHPHGAVTRGVFVAHPDKDKEFAGSEPIAHDDWNPQTIGVEKFGRNPVKQALDKIRRYVKESFTQETDVVDEGSVDDVAVGLSSLLGGLMADTEPFGPPRGPSPTKVGRGRPRSLVVDRVDLAVNERGQRVSRFHVTVNSPAQGAPMRVLAQPYVLTDSGLEGDAPIGALEPEVIAWLDETGKPLAPSAEAELPAGTSEAVVVVAQPDDVVAGVIIVEVPESGAAG